MMIMCGYKEDEDNSETQSYPDATEETLEETPEVSLHSLTNPMNPRIF